MVKTIVQKVVFENTTAKDVYELYMNAKKHSVSTAAAASITKKVGEKWNAHDKHITGRNLHLVKNKLIVQTWRGNDWPKQAEDSIFTIYFEPDGDNVIVNMVHANIPEEHYESIKKGWPKYYWRRWKKYLQGKPVENSNDM